MPFLHMSIDNKMLLSLSRRKATPESNTRAETSVNHIEGSLVRKLRRPGYAIKAPKMFTSVASVFVAMSLQLYTFSGEHWRILRNLIGDNSDNELN